MLWIIEAKELRILFYGQQNLPFSINICEQKDDPLKSLDVLSPPFIKENIPSEVGLQNKKKQSWSSIQLDSETIFLDEALSSVWGESEFKMVFTCLVFKILLL